MPATAILSVRVSPAEKAMLEVAADQSRSTVSEFMRRKALEAAEHEILDRRIIALPEGAWDIFEAQLNEPAHPIPALQELFNKTPAWSK